MSEKIIEMLEKDIENIQTLRNDGLYHRHDAYLLKKYAKKIIDRIKKMEND